MTLPDVVENYIHRIGRVGRAGSLGLAISIVAAKDCHEKVWYYDKRKWKGKKLSTELAVIDKNGRPVKGGCCTWYDEPDLLSQVETRLGSEIPTMSPSNLNLPRQISDAMNRGVLFGSSAEFQGRVKSDEALKALTRAVKNLNDLEIRARF